MSILIKNGRILTMSAQGTLNPGEVLVEGGKIAAVGQNLEHGPDCRVIDAGGGWVMPGLVDAHCHIGIFGTAAEGDDGNETAGPITPQLRAIDGVNPLDPEFSLAVKNGVTTVATGPGSANPIGGQFAAIKTFGRSVDEMLLRAPLAMKIAFGENPKKVYGKNGKEPATRMATAALIREWLYRALEYAAKKDAANTAPDKMPAYDIRLEALEPAVRKQIPLKAHAHRADDIMTALRIAKEFGLDITLDHCTEGHLIAENIAAHGKGIILGPFAGFPSKPELVNRSLESAAILHKAGAKVAIMTDMPIAHMWFLPISAGLCARHGLPEEEAFRAITVNPAEILGLSSRIGSLEPGKDADIAVFSGNPLESLRSRCVLTLIDGEVRYSDILDLLHN